MASELVVTAVGPDRPGLVGEITGCVARSGGNIAYTRMSNLCGRFAILALVEGSEVALERVRAALDAEADRLQLRIDIESSDRGAIEEGLPYVFRAYGLDQPGIVHQITSLLSAHKVNVNELSSTLQATRFSSALAFAVEGKISVPRSGSVRHVREALEALGHSMNVDVTMDPVQSSL